jgi:hypothetical protein
MVFVNRKRFAKPYKPTRKAKLGGSVCLSNRTTKTTDKPTDKEEHRTDNSGFAKKRVQWLIEHSISHQLLWCIESFVFRNPPLRQAPNRWQQV